VWQREIQILDNGSESSREQKFQGTKVPGSESSTYGTFAPGSKSTRERKFQLPLRACGAAGLLLQHMEQSLCNIPSVGAHAAEHMEQLLSRSMWTCGLPEYMEYSM